MTAGWSRTVRAALAGAVLCAAVGGAQAQGLAGPYLAANQADVRNDYAAASTYYDAAIEVLPGDARLINNSLVTNLIAGRLARAQDLAAQLEPLDPDNQLVALTFLAEHLSAGNFDRALEIVGNDAYQMNPLFVRLIEGWSLVGKGDFGGGAAVFGSMNGNDAMQVYGQLNQALALAFAGDFESAAALLDGDDQGPLHLNRLSILAHVVSLSQTGRAEDAIRVLETLLAGRNGGDIEFTALRQRLLAGEELEFTQITSASEGAANVFAVMGGALTREDSERLGLVYARLGTHVRPGYDELYALIGDVLALQGQYELAVDAYEEIAPGSPWYINAEIGRAEALEDAGRVDEGIEVLSNLARSRPEQIPVHIALGDALRENEEWEKATAAYSKAISLVQTPGLPHWRLFYARAITYERRDLWPEAEADFRKALELNPDQPHVLNYLGYSMVELGLNLEEAEQMIRKAVEQRNDSGYITDSLGWVLYRLGRYEEAVAPMERAVELEPVDPVINDHLGDVLWMVGRKLEAQFQWKRALSFDPEEEDALRIRAKLERGLDAVLAEEEAEEDAAATANGD